uniref:Uncharacterized protein n=1 Tax=Eptatretus burgeri TaxID=7764 RepID=A0A8C4R427_EPTBU
MKIEQFWAYYGESLKCYSFTLRTPFAALTDVNMAGQARGFGDGMEKDEGELEHDGCSKDSDEEELPGNNWDLSWLAGLDEEDDVDEVEVEAVRISVPRSALVRERKANKGGIAVAGGVGGRLCRKEEGDVEEDGEEELEEEERAKLVREKDAAVRELAVQLQLNRELKALLVASLGSDVQRKVEALVREHLMQAALSQETSRKLSAVTERAERLHIQCDVWRSKSIGSRCACLVFLRLKLSERAEKRARRAVHALLAEHGQLHRDIVLLPKTKASLGSTGMGKKGFSPGRLNIGRFHMYTRYEGITLNCCPHCTGDIIVL